MTQTNRLMCVAEVADGLSNSLCVVECANRPARILGPRRHARPRPGRRLPPFAKFRLGAN